MLFQLGIGTKSGKFVEEIFGRQLVGHFKW
jgi:hypothetical protein